MCINLVGVQRVSDTGEEGPQTVEEQLPHRGQGFV